MADELTARTGRQHQRYDKEYRLVAGCIPYRYKESGEACNGTQELEVLMVFSRDGMALLFPKGGWENDESVQEAACRETFEEAGVRGIIKVSFNFTSFINGRVHVTVASILDIVSVLFSIRRIWDAGISGAKGTKMTVV